MLFSATVWGFSTLPWRMQPGEGHLYLHTLKHTRSVGASHDSPRAQTCTFEGPSASNTTQIPREDPQEREDRIKIVAGGEKKARNFGRSRGRAVQQGSGPAGSGPVEGGPAEGTKIFWPRGREEGGPGGTGGYGRLWPIQFGPIHFWPKLVVGGLANFSQSIFRQSVSVLLLLLLFGTPLNACACTLRITRACKPAANSTHRDLETWACAPQKSTYPGPGVNRTVL